MFQTVKSVTKICHRSYKNFGHKRQPVPTVTTLWHGFLTLTFIGLGIEWKRLKVLLFGDSSLIEDPEVKTEIQNS